MQVAEKLTHGQQLVEPHLQAVQNVGVLANSAYLMAESLRKGRIYMTSFLFLFLLKP
jgi:hypothetical protein